jgi:hypothetical protein
LGGHDLVDHRLVFQQFIERARADGGAQAQLQLAVQVLGGLGQFLVGGQHVSAFR